MNKYKYIYDINKGHHIKVLLEDDAQTTDTNNTETDNKQEQTKGKSLSTNDKYNAIQQSLTNINAEYAKKIADAKKAVDVATEAAAQMTTTSVYDSVETNANVIATKLKVADLEFEFATKKHEAEKQLAAVKKELGQITVEGKALPLKYRHLNESNIHNAKVYVNNLVDTEGERIKNMNDFKRSFRDSELLYGKDRQGYFVVCVDQADFDKMYDTLQEVGYLRDEIIDNIMPQLFNRKELIQ